MSYIGGYLMRIDLHTHTTMSDGSLTPNELIRRAVDKKVDVLSITDHDSIEAYSQLSASELNSLRIIPGIEFSTRWRKTEIHILGLNIDLDNKILKAGIETQQITREQRAESIAKKLMKLGIEDPLPAVTILAANAKNIGRPHFAQHLADIGYVKNQSDAFKKYLAIGKPAYSQTQWVSLEKSIEWIIAANGIPVLAHPANYSFTRTKLRELLNAFKHSGGKGMEVLSGSQNMDITRNLSRLCNDMQLLASCGSDFHSPKRFRPDIGQIDQLPSACIPVWQNWSI